MEFTEQELSIITRIIGNHCLGPNGSYKALDRLYEKLTRVSGDIGPYKAATEHPYGDRPMIQID
jgi:hypothetical protein